MYFGILRNIRTFAYLGCGLLSLAWGCAPQTSGEIAQKKVYIAETDSGYQLIKDGEPFFVKGACVGDAYWAEFKAAGGNTIRIYDPTNLREKLDRADSLGLMVAVDIPLPKYREENNWYAVPGNVAQATKRITELVTTNRDHPALLYWNLGNEIYPLSLIGNEFTKQFNTWTRLIHDLDPNHPVTSAFPGIGRRMVASKSLHNPLLDFMSFNFFGAASSIHTRISQLSPFWKGPFMVAEWGINGPWESRETTTWKAPIEQSSSKKAEIYGQRYRQIRELFPGRFLGSFVFYWGQKEEQTPTWFSAFLPDGRPTQVVHQVAGFFGEKSAPYSGPALGYILLEGRGAPSSITLPPGKEVTATIHNTRPHPSRLKIQWELHPENWNRDGSGKWDRSTAIPVNFEIQESGEVRFTTPEAEGPYRLYLYLGDAQGRAATANIPFFILNPEDGQ